MPCYNPITAWRKKHVDPKSGKRGITFTRSQGVVELELQIPCGRCMGCRIRKSIDWAMRCVHESQMHDENCFITLTYDEEHLPKDGSLNKKHFQDFMKRLRKAKHPSKIRFFMCGEYGEQLERPHYHAILFNCDFSDKKPIKYSNKSILYTSKQLETLWGKGHVSIGQANYTTAAYCARYTTKKIFGEKAEDWYQGRQPEYAQMSLRPGLGKDYAIKFQEELKRNDSVVMNGREYPLPSYYEWVFDDLEHQKRIRKSKINKEENTISRLRVKEEIKLNKDKLYGNER